MGDSSGSALSVDQGGEVRRKAKINMVDQNQSIEENPRHIKHNLLELWIKKALSDELYKAKKETESEIWR